MNVSGKTSRSTPSLFARSIQATALLAVDKASMNTGETWAAATYILKNHYRTLFSVHLKSSAASTTDKQSRLSRPIQHEITPNERERERNDFGCRACLAQKA